MISGTEEVQIYMEELVNLVRNEGTLGSGHSEEERTNDVIDMIFKAYDIYLSERG